MHRTARRRTLIVLALGALAVAGAPAMADDTQESKIALDQLSQSEWEHVLAAPSLSGPSGLLHVIQAQSVLPRSIRAGVLFDGFASKPFLFSVPPLDADFRLNHGIGIIVGGPDISLLRQGELYLTLGGSYNRNRRNDPARSDPVAITSLGNLQFGIKLGWALPSGWSVGARLGLRFWNAPLGTRLKPDALAGVFDALASWDRLRVSRVPLRLNLNLGGQLDNSDTLLPSAGCPGATSLDACLRSRAAETFAYQVSQSQLRIAFGLELPFRFVTPGGYFGFSPILEYSAAMMVGAGDSVIAQAGAAGGLDTFNHRLSQQATAALRLRPGARFVIDLAADLGIASTSLRFGARLPLWQARLGISYSYDFDGVHVTAAPPPTLAASLAALESAPAVSPDSAVEVSPSSQSGALPAASSTLSSSASAPGCESCPTCASGAACEPAPKCEAVPACEVAKCEAAPQCVPSLAVAAAAASKPAKKLLRHRAHFRHEGVLLGLNDAIFFREATALVMPDSVSVLADVAVYVNAQPNIQVVSIAALNEDGGAARNSKLAHDRVFAVIRYLRSQGVPADKLQARGLGIKRPPKLPPGPADQPVELRIFLSMETAPP